MNTIDQRILIPVSPESIWGIISNIEDNKQWQVHCAKVSFLTTNRQGQGVRYRFSNPSGRDYVAEITAWYDNVGYAYQLIDGVNFRYNRGRIRLQEIAEGTIVQWVFEYEAGGILGGLRNTLSTRRQTENNIIESLRNLWRVATKDRAGEQYVSKTLMQEAPDAESRAQYKSRHPSPVINEASTGGSDEFLTEPPVAEDDTRPRPATASSVTDDNELGAIADAEMNAEGLREPDFLSDFDAPSVTAPQSADQADHSIFQPPVEEQMPPASQDAPPTPPSIKRVEIEPVAEDDQTAVDDIVIDDGMDDESSIIITEAKAEMTGDDVSDAMEIPEETILPVIPVPPETVGDDADDIADTKDAETTAQQAQSETPLSAVDKRDTASLSVFEIFGLPKPSETQQMAAITEADIEAAEAGTARPEALAATTQAISPPDMESRQKTTTGWRLSARRRLIKLRRR
ncbi:MAG: SRPBCC family protein [Anaerolineaceae bacterium]|nr:MAG: SRPBCC family protein [Anaerolineaceae bacterium]